jgi:hypothetical protein
VSARSLEADDAPLVERLIDEYPFKPYRNYRLLSRQRQSRVMHAEITGTLQAADGFGLVVERNEAGAIALGKRLPWDSTFFGVPMGRIEYLLRSANADRETVRAAVQSALDRFRAIGISHVAIRLDVGDADTLTIVEDEGFRLMDAIVTYISHPKQPPPRAPKELGIVRPFVDDDLEQVLEITREAFRDFRGRFQADPHLPRDRSEAFYAEWARKCCSGEMAERTLVADSGGRQLIGWASVRRAEPVTSVGGVGVSSGSLGACRPERPGAYAGLIATIASENHAAGVLTEAQTQNANFPMIRVLEAVGAQYVRAEYTFHAWLD